MRITPNYHDPEHMRRQATAFACSSLQQMGYTLESVQNDPDGVMWWITAKGEASSTGVRSWQELCQFEREVREAGKCT